MRRFIAVWVLAGLCLAWLGWLYATGDKGSVPSFRDQACSLPGEWLQRIQRGYHPERSGEISILPKTPAYIASGAGGTTHSGPWPYLQDVPLVFYGPGYVPEGVSVDRAVTLADVAPSIARWLRGSFQTDDGAVLNEAAPLTERVLLRPPKLIVNVVWDGGGWNVLDQWPDAWPNLARLIEGGTSFTEATVGSSPSVTPSIHTTLGTGVFPATHGVTDIKLRDEQGAVVDSFENGESSRFIAAPTISERWDEQKDNEALIGMIAYEPWHLGMIGQGAEIPSGDKDHAAWLDVKTNDWVTNEAHYELPAAIVETEGLEADIEATDAIDGEEDGAWRNRRILDDRERIEELPGFIAYHGRALRNLIGEEGYGDDDITDLIYTNFKQIDRVGHYFGMASPEVRDSVVESDRQLGELVDYLDDEVGAGRWVVIVTADHGQQPNAIDSDGFAIDAIEFESDIVERFGPILDEGWATQLFLKEDEMAERDISIEDVARYVADYRVIDNTLRPDMLFTGAGSFDPRDRVFDLAVPSAMLPSISC